MKRTIKLCTQGDVQQPCGFRQVVPVHSDTNELDYLKLCSTRNICICSSQVFTTVNVEIPQAFCGPVLQEVSHG